MCQLSATSRRTHQMDVECGLTTCSSLGGFHEEVRVKALNEVEEWGPSDHCRDLDRGRTWKWSGFRLSASAHRPGALAAA